MLTLLRTLMLLALVIWIGGIVFFSAVEAPEVVHVLGVGNPAFAEIINRSLSILHYFGFACGLLFIFADLAVRATARQNIIAGDVSAVRAAQSSDVRILLVCAMLALTAFSQFGIMRRMHVIRTSNAGFEQLSPATPARVEFSRLHRYSVDTE
ncbi:MAG TPA: DUF4149 domain-containing protein, partial [Terriglobales bacterium]